MYSYIFINIHILSVVYSPYDKFVVNVRYHDDGSKKLNACTRVFLHMVYFSPKHKALLFADKVYDIHMHRCMHTTTMISCQPISLLPALALSCPFHMVQPFFYLLGDPASFARGANTHPLLCPWFAINCSPLAASSTPRHPIDQVMYIFT